MPGSPRLVSVLFASGLSALIGICVSACRAPTQLTLELRTDAPCTSVRGVSVTVGAPGKIESAPPGTTTSACTGDGYIGTIAIAPAGDKSGRVAIRAVLGIDVPAEQCSAETKYKGCIVVRRELAFVPHTTSVVPIGFYLACRNVACDGSSTCDANTNCAPSGEVPGKPTRDGGTGGDGATANDAGPFRCTVAADCPTLETRLPGCAEALCGGNNECIYIAKDEDNDNDRGARCESMVPGITVNKLGGDCDDTNPNINSLGAAPALGTLNCKDSVDSNCNGILDADEVIKLASPDSDNVCANLYGCPTGTIYPERMPLFRTDTGRYTLDNGVGATITLVGYLPTYTSGGFPPNSVFLNTIAGTTKIFPSGLTSKCNPGASNFGFTFTDGGVTHYAITSLPTQ